MKKYLFFFPLFLVVLACEKDLSTALEPIGIIQDTVYICPPEDLDIARVNMVRTYRETARGCKSVYRLPGITNVLGNAQYIWNCPIIFYDDCDSIYNDTLQFKNVGPEVIFSPTFTKLIGNIYYNIDSVAEAYIHYLPGFPSPVFAAVAPPDSMLYISYESCNFPLIFKSHENFAVKGSKVILVE